MPAKHHYLQFPVQKDSVAVSRMDLVVHTIQPSLQKTQQMFYILDSNSIKLCVFSGFTSEKIKNALRAFSVACWQ